MTEADLKKMKIADIKEWAEEQGIEVPDIRMKKADLISFILESQEDDEEELDDLEDEEELEDEEDDEEDLDDDEEEVEEEDDSEEQEEEVEEEEPTETLTAKQVATRIGTDAKTLRKFLRSEDSHVDPVGRGGRYEFDANDVAQIKKEFAAWQGKTIKRAPKKNKAQAVAEKVAQAEMEEEEELELDLDLDDLEDDDLDLDDFELED